MLNNNIMPNHNINYENEINILNAKLQYYINEKEKNEKLSKNLKKYNQILNHNNIKQARYNNMINTKKQESEKSSEYNEENNNILNLTIIHPLASIFLKNFRGGLCRDLR